MAVALTCRPVSDPSLQVVQSPVVQSPDEVVTYALTTTEIGSSPTSPAVAAKDLTDNQTVTAQVLTGSASVSGDIITLPTVGGLIVGHLYRIDIQFTISGAGGPFERQLRIKCRD
jgi:hypothetical protein